MKIIPILIVLAVLFLLSEKEEPFMLDGPGMVYVDSHERTEYANAIETVDSDEYSDEDYTNFVCAAGFMGYGEAGKKSAIQFVENNFAKLSQEQRKVIRQVICEGNQWYVVVPRYYDGTTVETIDEKGNVIDEVCQVENGTPFIIRCNPSNLCSNVKISSLSRGVVYEFSPLANEKGKLIKSENIMDLTNNERRW